MAKVFLVFKGSFDNELDRIEIEVRDPEDCTREVLAAMNHAGWVISVGDRVEVQPES